MNMKQEECLICKAQIEYLENNVLMECAICHKKAARPDVSMGITSAMNVIRREWTRLSVFAFRKHQRILSLSFRK